MNYTLAWAKKVKRMPLFFRFFRKRSLLSCPYFVIITSVFSKTRSSHDIFFFNFSWKTYNSHAHIWSKKCQSCKHYLILWAKKVNVTKKSMLLWHAHILSKNFHSLKKLCPHSHILSKKTSTLSKTWCSHVIFLKYNMENALLSRSYLVKNKLNSFKATV